jgi:glucose-6-phosphate 1-dehydrogenase
MRQGDRREVVDSRYLQTCDIPAGPIRVGPFTLVIFGATGSLCRLKLMPTLFRLYRDKELPEYFSILGFGRTEYRDSDFRVLMKKALDEAEDGVIDKELWDGFCEHLFYSSGQVSEDETMLRLLSRLREPKIEADKNVIYYLAVPPVMTPDIVRRLKAFDMCGGLFNAKIVIEKPFGSDGVSARVLNSVLKDAFIEKQIYRIDHYLGKETVQNIMMFRFSNAIFEQIWNGRYIDNVQITIAEDIGIEHRGEFYEKAGVVRDIIQNHALQIMAIIGMEAPIGFEADLIRDEKIKVFRSIRPMNLEDVKCCVVSGQYAAGTINGNAVVAYRDEEKVSKSSVTPTYFAGKFHIDNLRWASVPFYIRSGKRLQKRVTEVCIEFKQLPLRLFGRTCDAMEPNVLVLTIQPDERIELRFGVKYPYSQNQIFTVNMDFNYREAFQRPYQDAYGRLLLDCMKGDLSLFVRDDMAEVMWDVVDPIIEGLSNISAGETPFYEAGTWGPEAADQLLEQDGRHWLTK